MVRELRPRAYEALRCYGANAESESSGVPRRTVGRWALALLIGTVEGETPISVPTLRTRL
jgi:hypothetical protein